jgi:hypothetical protein
MKTSRPGFAQSGDRPSVCFCAALGIFISTLGDPQRAMFGVRSVENVLSASSRHPSRSRQAELRPATERDGPQAAWRAEATEPAVDNRR